MGIVGDVQKKGEICKKLTVEEKIAVLERKLSVARVKLSLGERRRSPAWRVRPRMCRCSSLHSAAQSWPVC